MKKILFFLAITFMIISCAQKPRVVYRYRLPENPCKHLERVYGEFYKKSIDNTSKENLLAELNNIDIALRMIQNREHILQCYEEIFNEEKK